MKQDGFNRYELKSIYLCLDTYLRSFFFNYSSRTHYLGTEDDRITGNPPWIGGLGIFNGVVTGDLGIFVGRIGLAMFTGKIAGDFGGFTGITG
jgi:hypothetical protein